MLLKKKLLENCKLYLVLDTQVKSYNELFEIAKKSIEAGVDILQLRDKTGSAREILKFTEKVLKLTKNRIPFIINDRLDLAMVSEAKGTHLGQEDLPLNAARRLGGKPMVIGVSCQSLNHALLAQKQGADYIGLGSVFKTFTKPDRRPMNLKLLEAVIKRIQIPVFAIGGITLENVERLIALGVKRAAVCRAVCEAKDVEKVVREFKRKL